jgi:hypothetical protein
MGTSSSFIDPASFDYFEGSKHKKGLLDNDRVSSGAPAARSIHVDRSNGGTPRCFAFRDGLLQQESLRVSKGHAERRET